VWQKVCHMVEQVVGLVSAVVPAVVRAVKEGRAMGKASRDKGARGERELVRMLRPLLPEGWTVRRALPYEHGDDIRVVDELGQAVPGSWSMECKRYADFSVGEVLRGPSSRWLDWWAQANRQAEHAGRAVMLCTRGDRRPWWVWTRHAFPIRHPHIELVLADGSVVCGTLLEGLLPEWGDYMGRRVEEVHSIRGANDDEA